jgi:hypothetical protein
MSKKINDILLGVKFPTDKEISKETHRVATARSNREKVLNPNTRANIIAANKKKANDPNWLKTIDKVLKNRAKDLKWQKAHAAAMRKHKGKAVVTYEGEFETTTDFEKATGKCWSDVKRFFPHLYYFKEAGPGEPTYETVHYTPYGVGTNRKECYRLARADGEQWACHYGLGSIPEYWTKVKKLYPKKYYSIKEPKRGGVDRSTSSGGWFIPKK